MSIDPFLTSLMIKVATSTAVNVISKRTLDPKIRMVGHVWRAYSLVDPALDLHNAWRIAAYSDMSGIIGTEIVVEKLSCDASSVIPALDGINFAVHQKAGGYLLEPDFTVQIAHKPDSLQAVNMRHSHTFVESEIATHGGALAEMTAPCVERAVRAHTTTQEILQHPESFELRRSDNWDRKENFLDRINTGLGYAIWRPVPVIGLGARTISNLTSYNGIFRRDIPEGYGRLTWTNGDIYDGQVRDGWERGYGVKRFADGRVFIGYFNDFHLSLGVSISAKRDRARYGAHQDGKLTGYGRQIGIRKGVDSFTGFWDKGELSGDKLPFHADTYQKIATNYSKNPQLADLSAEYQAKADAAKSVRRMNDQPILSLISNFI